MGQVSWQPIETAPRDEMILVIHQQLGMIQAELCTAMLESPAEERHEFPWDSPAGQGSWLYSKDITHWMPLPEPPQVTA